MQDSHTKLIRLMKLAELLVSRAETLSIAESCTGGLIGSMLTDVPGASAWFLGGVISYSDDVKINVLGVDPLIIEEKGAVSEETAVQMARGIMRLTGSDIGAAVTGIAGPLGGVPGKPVGTVCMALASEMSDESITMHFTGPRMVVRMASADYLLDMLLVRLGGRL